MKRSSLVLLPLFVLFSACSEKAQESASSIELREEVSGGAGAARKAEGAQSPSQAASIPVSVPKIAYVFDYGFRIAASEIPALQRRHVELCEKQGPQICRVLQMRQSGEEGDYASGSLSLDVAAPRARAFGTELTKAADAAGGTEVSSAISGEDLSKQIVDTEARLRARSLLRDRLMEVLATRKGTVAELVEAERGVAQVNEEIDQARGWLAEMQGRVDFSRVNIGYNAGTPSSGGFMAPIRGALGNLSSILGMLFAALIIAGTVLIPLGLIGWGLRKAWKKLRQPRVIDEQQSET
jgi:hypothetical protein